ncbi:MAG: replication factor C large subunit [Thermoplasmata archaeon]|jgi:replication factor C large subunit|nr:replication factor C large subunit [Thermoplasmata archaeon]MVT14207.1 replication factor C large subunit [Euryarchaeota archaeon]MVT35888.1 replication factor C large subunit [Euryarchaeota archaeon]
MIEWAEKYRPKSLKDIIGNPEVVKKIREWGELWKSGKIPDKKALVFEGRPGVGKTTAALALANDMGWGVIELNASDIRNEERIKDIALRGSLYETFDDSGDFLSSKKGGRKLIIIDEADNLYEGRGEAGDRGGRKAIIETVKSTLQPIILIVNDPYELFKGEQGIVLKNMVEELKFRALNYKQIAASILKPICAKEGILVDSKVLEKIAQRSGGDVRAAINDLQMLAMGKKIITEKDAEYVGSRDVVENIYSATLDIILSMSMKTSREVLNSLDEDPQTILQWIDENISQEYLDIDDLDRAFYYLSLANTYLGRIRKRQYYGFLSYVMDFIAAVSIAKKQKYGIHGKLKSPDFIRAMAMRKRSKDYRDIISKKLAKITHQSIDRTSFEFFEIYMKIFRENRRFAIWQTAILSLSEQEVEFLMGSDEQVDSIVDEARKLRERLK